MKIDECWFELEMERSRHEQTKGMLREVCAAWQREHGEEFRFKDSFWNDKRPSLLKRLGRTIWPFKLVVR
jgi:hypothetical protein